MTCHNPLYPALARQSAQAPTFLYYKRKIRKNSTGVAIVGSRRCTDYGKQAAVEAASFLAQYNVPVISGMAKGIDGYAHTACYKPAPKDTKAALLLDPNYLFEFQSLL